MLKNLYLLALHEPYESPQHPVPIDATIVPAATLLHPDVPQPDGGLLYRCLTEFPGRTPGCIVPLSTVTYEVGGHLWSLLDDWPAVVEAVVDIARAGDSDAVPLGLTDRQIALFGNGPTTVNTLIGSDGRHETAGPDERRAELATLEARIQQMVGDEPLWPGDNLLDPPWEPASLPYEPGSGSSPHPVR